jgi:hypothetical protein
VEKLRKLRKDFNMRVKLERNIGKKGEGVMGGSL